MVEQARRRAMTAERHEQIGLVVGDVARLPYSDGTFDLVISSMSQHHWTDPPAALRELRRVLRPEGRLWIYDIRRRLPRAETAARTLFPEHTVHSEPLRNGWLPLHITARLTVEPA
jgi:ubiquinone/menaquinone biosynthesis C-methylase UbiE